MAPRFERLMQHVLFLSFLAMGAAFAQQDVKGAKDHPLVSRMPDYYISKYEVSEFAGFDPTVIGGKDVHWEGRKYVYGYARKESGRPIGMLQLVRNYEAAIKKAGGTILGGDERRLAAEIRKPDAVTGVYLEAFNEGQNYELTIVASAPMKQEVVADAAAMNKDLMASGKTIVHGIYFDTGSASIKPQSEAALSEMVKLLKSAPALKVYVVGHTDMDGSAEANLKLSADRAASVVKAIAGRGIATARLKSAGVGPYAPVGSNDSEEGKAQNRRVELVKQ